MKKCSLILIIAVLTLVSFSCKKSLNDEPNPDNNTNSFTDLVVPDGFTWSTSEYLQIDLTFVDNNQQPVVTSFEIYSDYPDGAKFLDGASNSEGKFNRKYKVASRRESITVVIPNQSPVVVPFEDITISINNKDSKAYQAKHTIIVENKGFKSVTEDTYQYYPAQDLFGTIGFEDLWPNKGDYDFNDVLIDYNVKATFNDDGNVTIINMALYLRASGAAFDNAFGISFKHSWAYEGSPSPDIASVTVNGSLIQPENTDYPSYILIPSIKDAMPTYNTFPNNSFVDPIFYNVEIIFNTPAEDWWEVDLPLNNPFIVVNQVRGKEVHLPYYLPTSLADPEFAHYADDYSDLFAFDPNNFKSGNMVIGYYTYMTEEGYPWAINVYFDEPNDNLFLYPIEKMDIREAYDPAFSGWVENYDPWEWYLPQHRVQGKVYEKIPETEYPGLD